MPLMGSTIKLKGEFKDFPDENGNSNYFDPTDIKFKVFDENKKQIGETVNIGAEHKQSIGVYIFFYVIPDINYAGLSKSDCKLYPEFTGLDFLGNPAKAKCEIVRKFK